MTNQEAIEEIKKLEYYGRPFDNSLEECNKASRKVMALNMAIKALEQEPLEVEATKLQKAYNKGFEDCRQAVLDLANTIQTDDFSGNELLEVVEVDDIKALPSVNPQEPKESEDKE